jgi:hypothetical protein
VFHGAHKLFGLVGIQRGVLLAEVDSMIDSLDDLQGTLADMQHHDAVTGTSTMKVTQDYMEKIQTSLDRTYRVYSKVIDHIVDENVNSSYDW